MSLTGAAGPEAGGAVMATGIVSVAIHSEGQETLSRALLVFTAVAWALLAVLFLKRLCFERARWRREAERPESLTAVAGTAVLGARLTLLGWSWAGWVLLASAALLCVILMGVLAGVRSFPGTGAGFLVVVAPQSLAVLAASLARDMAIVWPALIALLQFAVGLCAYAFMLARFDFLQLRSGAGGHWIAGGAIAISTLACAAIAQATAVSHVLGGIHEPLRIASLVLWALTIAWLPVLIGAEVRWRRPSYDARRWATVFPLGMYSVMSSATGNVASVHPLVEFGNDWAWVALAAWAATTVGVARRVARTRSRRGPIEAKARVADQAVLDRER
jgi:Voltage-dependent anion channel